MKRKRKEKKERKRKKEKKRKEKKRREEKKKEIRKEKEIYTQKGPIHSFKQKIGLVSKLLISVRIKLVYHIGLSAYECFNIGI